MLLRHGLPPHSSAAAIPEGQLRTFPLVIGALLLGLGGTLTLAQYRWRARSAHLVAQLRRVGRAAQRARYSEAEVAGLPAPVARYFRAVLRDGQPGVRKSQRRTWSGGAGR